MAEELKGEELHERAAELEIEGRSQMTADELRAAVAKEEATPETVWERYSGLYEELKQLVVAAREAGEKELSRGLDRARRELDHHSVINYNPEA